MRIIFSFRTIAFVASYSSVPSDFSRTLSRFSTFIVLSPHLDDAILSCGFFLRKLKQAKKRTLVVTVFTEPTGPPWTKLARDFTRECGFSDPFVFFQARKEEDRRAMGAVGSEYVHLDYVDAAWRKTKAALSIPMLQFFAWLLPSLTFVYPGKRGQFSGNISPEDTALVGSIAASIKRTIKGYSNCVLFVPMGIGGHADHVLVKKAAALLGLPVYYWEDYPYLLDRDGVMRVLEKEPFSEAFAVSGDTKDKQSLIRIYKSQMSSLFPSGDIPLAAERYYAKETGRRVNK